VTISALKGLFHASGTLASTHLHNISAAAGADGVISAGAMLDAQQKLGDAKGALTAVAMHSATENVLAKANLITYIQPSEGSARVPMYHGKQVIVDDSLPVATGVYDTYLFGAGAFGFADVANSKVTMTEMDRDSLAGEDILINRRHFVLHPRGVAFNAAAPTGGGPTNATLEAAATWARVYEPKNVRIVCLRHKIAA
jgi:uncharacterized sodium:solute symporter family permease YidK